MCVEKGPCSKKRTRRKRRKENSNESVNSLVSVVLGCTDQNYHMALGEGTSGPSIIKYEAFILMAFPQLVLSYYVLMALTTENFFKAS